MYSTEHIIVTTAIQATPVAVPCDTFYTYFASLHLSSPSFPSPPPHLLEEGGERERESLIRERNINWLSLECTPGMCPDQKSDLRPFGVWDNAPAKSHQPGLFLSFISFWFFSVLVLLEILRDVHQLMASRLKRFISYSFCVSEHMGETLFFLVSWQSYIWSELVLIWGQLISLKMCT